MKKKMTSQELLAKTIKDMHPVYASYFMQRLQHDIKEVTDQIPAIYAKDREDMAKGRIGFFHPDFYVNYVNEFIQVFNEIDGTNVPLVEYERESVVDDTPTQNADLSKV
jgi:hypothetical protein